MALSLTLSHLLLFLVSVCASRSLEGEGDVFQWPIYMPSAGSKALKQNDYRCRASKLPPNNNYIVSYEPRADPSVAHHMLVFGCRALREGLQDSSSWSCKSSTVCSAFNAPSIIYAWALNASGFQLPPGVGQKVGPANNINYVVVQIHYGEMETTEVVSPVHSDEESLALILHMTHVSQQRVSGVYLLASSTRIRPGKKDVTTDTACKFRGPKTIVPIAFRTHAHAHSTEIVGYVGDGGDNWQEIGVRSPQDPQAFYPANNVSVNPGDWLASRCVYDTTGRTHSIHMGPDTKDEMCNFYIMYHTENDGRSLTYEDCWDPAPSHVHYPPLPVLPPSHHHHDHSMMPGGPDPPIEHTHPTPNTARPSDVITPPTVPDDYVCPSPVPPGASSRCPETKPTVRPSTPTTEKGGEGNTGSEGEDGVSHTDMINLVPAKDWPYNGVDSPKVEVKTGRGGALGQVTSVAVVADGSVLVLHRGPRIWDYNSFTYTNVFADAGSGPIAIPTVLKFSSKGVFQQSWGAGLFYLPHSITIDHNGNIWVTDVAMHQVFLFTGLDVNQPALTLGHKLVPGTKPDYFCKPADVAVSTSGTFYVADGYCNSRVVAYNANGEMKNIFADFPIKGETLFVPHSLALNPTEDLLYVADRENQRIVSIETSSGKVQVFSAERGLGHVFGLCFSRVREGGWPLVTVSETSDGNGYGVAVGAKGDIETVWGYLQRFASIHDVAVDSVSKAIYVTELGPPRIWKFVHTSAGSNAGDDVTAQPPSVTHSEESNVTTDHPTLIPGHPTGHPTDQPSVTTDHVTTGHPTDKSGHPTDQSSVTTDHPTDQPSVTTGHPTDKSGQPIDQPSVTTDYPTDQPSTTTGHPTDQPSVTTGHPTHISGQPTDQPSPTTGQPTLITGHPTDISGHPTDQPSVTTGHPTSTTGLPTDESGLPTNKVDHPTGHPSEKSDTTATPTTVEPDIITPTENTDTAIDSGSAPTYPSSGDLSSSEGTTAEVEVDSNSHHSSKSKSNKKVETPAFHYGLFAALFAIVVLILIVIIGILKEHRYCRFRARRLLRKVKEPNNKTPRDALHSLLGPSKLGFSRLRTYDSDSEVEEFPIFSRQS